jgi:hypothetical protein
MQGTEGCRLRRIRNTPQGEAIESNAADDTLLVDQERGIMMEKERRRLTETVSGSG